MNQEERKMAKRNNETLLATKEQNKHVIQNYQNEDRNGWKKARNTILRHLILHFKIDDKVT